MSDETMYPADTAAINELSVLDTPSLANLAKVLRDKSLWPEGFQWDYTHCETCAMGLAHKLWKLSGVPRLDQTWRVSTMEIIGMHDPEAAEKIFCRAARLVGVEWGRDVTPEHIADLLDDYIACRAAKGLEG